MFYDRYVELCEKARKKPYTVAREIGLGTSNVAVWKKGSTPRPDVLQKLAAYFGVSQAVLLGLDEKEKPLTNGEGLTETQKKAWELIQNLDDEKLIAFLKMMGE